MTEVSVRRRAFLYLREMGCNVLVILVWFPFFIVFWAYLR